MIIFQANALLYIAANGLHCREVIFKKVELVDAICRNVVFKYEGYYHNYD